MATQTATATFNGAQPLDGDLPFIDITWGTAYASAAAYQIAKGEVVTDGSGPIVANFKTKTATGVRVTVSDQFTGTVELTAVDK